MTSGVRYPIGRAPRDWPAARARMADSHLGSAGWEGFTRSAPTIRAFNHLIAGTYFERRFGRWPISPRQPGASINDYIFDRMIGDQWSARHRSFVDKDTAKREARRAVPGIRIAETLAVIPMRAIGSVNQLYECLQPFIGTDTIAKPAHSSGAATFLRGVRSPGDLRVLHDLASLDYAFCMREMQYLGLPRQIIVETLVPTATGAPSDYKFHCVGGEPLLCQIDHARFGAPWSRLFRVPDFRAMDPDDGLVPPADFALPTAEQRASMIAAARALAAPFDFVRVDLYLGADGIYFGELTFTPAASLGVAPAAAGDHAENSTHHIYSRIMMDALAEIQQPAKRTG